VSDKEVRGESGETEDVWVQEFDDEALIQFEEEVFERFHDNPRKPIIIKISSPGGAVDAAMGMIDIMNSVSSIANPDYFYFVTVAIGKAMSAGALILSHGDYRFCTPNSRVMLHQASKFFWGGVKPDVDVEYREFTRINKNVLTVLAENCKLKGGYKALEKLLQRDLYLDAIEAREFGIVDIIGYPKLNEMKAYELSVTDGLVPKDKKVEKRRRSVERPGKAAKRNPKKNRKGKAVSKSN